MNVWAVASISPLITGRAVSMIQTMKAGGALAVLAVNTITARITVQKGANND
jgi:hypothetical protein